MAADESVPTGTDPTLSVIDDEGATYSWKVSALKDYSGAGTRRANGGSMKR